MPLHDAKRLRLLAVEALAVASNMADPGCRRMMLGIAASYERLADHAEERETVATQHARKLRGSKENN